MKTVEINFPHDIDSNQISHAMYLIRRNCVLYDNAVSNTDDRCYYILFANSEIEKVAKAITAIYDRHYEIMFVSHIE